MLSRAEFAADTEDVGAAMEVGVAGPAIGAVFLRRQGEAIAVPIVVSAAA